MILVVTLALQLTTKTRMYLSNL